MAYCLKEKSGELAQSFGFDFARALAQLSVLILLDLIPNAAAPALCDFFKGWETMLSTS